MLANPTPETAGRRPRLAQERRRQQLGRMPTVLKGGRGQTAGPDLLSNRSPSYKRTASAPGVCLDALGGEGHHPRVSGTVQVAARVMGLCLDRHGHLVDNDYLAMAVRGGLLVDLALAQRLTQADDSVELELTPTGWPPADRALDELEGRSLDWWLEHSAVRLADVATALVAEGTWTRLRPRPLQVKP